MVDADAGEAEAALNALLDDETSKLGILEYLRKWLGDKYGVGCRGPTAQSDHCWWPDHFEEESEQEENDRHSAKGDATEGAVVFLERLENC